MADILVIDHDNGNIESHQGHMMPAMPSPSRPGAVSPQGKSFAGLLSLPVPSPEQHEDNDQLNNWKNFCADSTLKKKNGPIRSLPVLSNRGSHSLYWSKKIFMSEGEVVNKDPSLLAHSLEKLIK